jgi:hypothetical protein
MGERRSPKRTLKPLNLSVCIGADAIVAMSHVPVAASQESTDYVCALCAVQCQTKAAMNKHIASDCKGIHPLQCPRCLERFKNHMGKSRHVRKGCRGGSVLDFVQTDLEAVKQLVVAAPAVFQVAGEHGELHAELCRATHFGEIAQNRNVFSVQDKGTEMKVLSDGKEQWQLKKSGISQILRNSVEIINDERVRPLLPAVLPTGRAASASIHSTIHSRGQYPARARIVSAMPSPRKAFEGERPEDSAAFDKALKWGRNVGENPGPVLAPMHEAVALRLLYHGDRWWALSQADRTSLGYDGWRLCKKGERAVEDCVRGVLDDVCTRVRRQGAQVHMDDVLDAVRHLYIGRVVEYVTTSLRSGGTCALAHQQR